MELQQSRQLEYILGRMLVGVAILDCTDLRMRYVNPYLLSLLEESWRSQGVIGQCLAEIAPAEVLTVALPILQQVCSSGQSKRFSDVPYEGFLKTRGRTYWRVSIEPSPDFASDAGVHEQAGTGVQQLSNACGALLVTVEDETSLVRSRLHTKAIHNVSSAIAGPLALPQVLDYILQAVQEMVGSTRCAVILIDQPISSPELLDPVLAEFQFSEKHSPAGSTPTISVAAERGLHLRSQDWRPEISEHVLVGLVTRYRRSLVIEDTSAVPEIEFPWLDDEGLARRPGSVLCVPIFEPTSSASKGEGFSANGSPFSIVLGTIEVYHRRVRGFPTEEIELLEEFAQQAGLAIQNARLFRSINHLAQVARAARERIEAEVVARTAELAQRNHALQMAKDDFFTTMAHELKTPLANIRAHVSALLTNDLKWSAQQQHDFLEAADEQIERLVGMVNHFLDASRVEAGALRLELEPILLPEMLEDMQDRLQALITSSQRRLEIDAPADLPAVLADYELIMSVLTNLLSNAFRYAPEGDVVRLEAEPIYSEPGQQLLGVELRVIDHGPGMTQEQQAELFTRFSTFAAMSRPAADRPGQSAPARRRGSLRWSPATGLGLYISRGIIEAHGSTLRLKSSPGEGATFAFILPVASTIKG
jgi:signal transduction histidine kinase